MKAGLRSFDRSCGLFLDLSVCPYIVAVIQLCSSGYVLFKISGTRGTKYVPFTIFVFKTTGKSTILIYINFKFHELWSMPKMLSNSL